MLSRLGTFQGAFKHLFPDGQRRLGNQWQPKAVARTHNAPLAGNKGEGREEEGEKTQVAFGFFEANFDTLRWFDKEYSRRSAHELREYHSKALKRPPKEDGPPNEARGSTGRG